MNLNFEDIASAVVAIDHAANEGVYKGWHDIRQVLALRDRLQAFVDAAKAAIAANKAAQALDQEASAQ